MNFKPRELTITDSMEVLSIIDTFVYRGNEYALAAPISDKTHTIHRICKWDEKESIAKLVEDPTLLMRLTSEFNKRNPGVLSEPSKNKSKVKLTKNTRQNHLDTAFIGMLESFDLHMTKPTQQLKAQISNLSSIQSFKISKSDKEMLIEILMSVFVTDNLRFRIGEMNRTDFIITLLLRLNEETYMNMYIEEILINIPNLEIIFPHIANAARKNNMLSFTIACRYMQRELQRYKNITVKDALFCNNSKEVLRLIKIVRKVLAKNHRFAEESCKAFIKKYTPDKIVAYLDKYIVGQSDAKKAAAMTLYRHVAIQAYPDKHFKKENLMIYGPSGCGKTEIFRVLAKISPVPLHIRSAAEITSNGYSGTDIKDLIMSLEQKEEDISKSIVVLDEADKLFMPEHDSNGENTNKSTQGDLLKIVEGSILTKGSNTVDTENITFVFVGAFADLYDEKTKVQRRIGFGAVDESLTDNDIYFSINDFITFGMIPELARRISMLAPVRKLNSNDYREIFTSIGNNVMDEASQFLSISNMRLELTSDDLIDEIVSTANTLNLGASGLRNIFCQAVNNKYYETVQKEAPGKQKSTIMITKEDIKKAAVHLGSL